MGASMQGALTGHPRRKKVVSSGEGLGEIWRAEKTGWAVRPSRGSHPGSRGAAWRHSLHPYPWSWLGGVSEQRPAGLGDEGQGPPHRGRETFAIQGLSQLCI